MGACWMLGEIVGETEGRLNQSRRGDTSTAKTKRTTTITMAPCQNLLRIVVTQKPCLVCRLMCDRGGVRDAMLPNNYKAQFCLRSSVRCMAPRAIGCAII